MTESCTTPNQTCSVCQRRFRCGSLGQDTTCWCYELPHLPLTHVNLDGGCLCPECLKKVLAQSAAPAKDELA